MRTGSASKILNVLENEINPATEESVQKLIGFEIPPHDFIQLSYTGDDMTGVIYKTGGSGGTTVATLALTYDAGVLQTITKS
jgi:hypothetical protein